MTIELNTLIAVVSIGMAVATFMIGRLTAAKQDGISAAEMRSELKHLCSATDRIEKKMDTEFTRITKEMVLVQSKAEAANIRLDLHEAGEHGITRPHRDRGGDDHD